MGLDVVEPLAAAGVHSLKIEGRLKGAEYVATTVRAYQKRRDQQAVSTDDLRDMALSYSRGFSTGFLSGTDHQTLVDGRFPKHRGVLLGTVRSVDGRDVLVEAAAAWLVSPRWIQNLGWAWFSTPATRRIQTSRVGLCSEWPMHKGSCGSALATQDRDSRASVQGSACG